MKPSGNVAWLNVKNQDWLIFSCIYKYIQHWHWNEVNTSEEEGKFNNIFNYEYKCIFLALKFPIERLQDLTLLWNSFQMSWQQHTVKENEFYTFGPFSLWNGLFQKGVVEGKSAAMPLFYSNSIAGWIDLSNEVQYVS